MDARSALRTFMPASRLMMDSMRSPNRLEKKMQTCRGAEAVASRTYDWAVRTHNSIYSPRPAASPQQHRRMIRRVALPPTPKPAAASGVAGQCVNRHSATATATLLASPPTAPSTVFFGLMSVSLVRPRLLPVEWGTNRALYPPIRHETGHRLPPSSIMTHDG